MKKAIVLLSGGLDSATTLYYAKDIGYKCHALIFDYRQRHRREILSAKKIARHAGVSYVVSKINLPWHGSALLDKKIHIPHHRGKGVPVTYVPARNTIFLSHALSYAEAVNAQAIFIGAHSEDYSGYPDCREKYFEAFDKVKNLGTKTGRKIKILRPIVYKNKSDIIKIGLKLGVPYGLTWSCYEGGKRPCSKCESCYYRAQGFKNLGLKDPAM